MLAQLVVNKFNCHIPEYRQMKMLSDHGVTLPRSTMNDWIHAVANLLYPLYESQCEAVRAVSILTDERTTALAAVGMRQK